MQEMRVLSLGREDPPKKEMATHSNILAWEIPWTEEPGGYSSWGRTRVRHDLVTKRQQQEPSLLVRFMENVGFLLPQLEALVQERHWFSQQTLQDSTLGDTVSEPGRVGFLMSVE